MFPFKSPYPSFSKLFDRAPRSFSSIHTKSTQHTLKLSPQQASRRSINHEPEPSSIHVHSQSQSPSVGIKVGKKLIKTYARFRPLPSQVSTSEQPSPVQHISSSNVIINNNSYKFQKVFHPNSTNQDIFLQTTLPLIDNLFQGKDSSLMAYGQTGSGKTFTMFGTETHKGIITMVAQQIFHRISTSNIKTRLYCSALEIYNQTLLDLINPDAKVKKLIGSVELVRDVGDLMGMVRRCEMGKKRRGTRMNQNSSRSHVVFVLYLEQEVGDVKRSKMSMVDLAGSERLDKIGNGGNVSGNVNQQSSTSSNFNSTFSSNANPNPNPSSTPPISHPHLLQTRNINLSLSCLTKTIRSLLHKHPYIPFRQSKLTQVLQDFFQGSVAMIVTCSSEGRCMGETVNSLRFGVESKRLEVGGGSGYGGYGRRGESEGVGIGEGLRREVEKWEERMGRLRRVLEQAGEQCQTNKYLKQICTILDYLPTSSLKQPSHSPISLLPFPSQDSSLCFDPTTLPSHTLQLSKLTSQISLLKRQISKLKQLIQPIQKDMKLKYLMFEKEVLMCQVEQLQKREKYQFQIKLWERVEEMREKDQYVKELERRVNVMGELIREKRQGEVGKRVVKIRKMEG